MKQLLRLADPLFRKFKEMGALSNADREFYKVNFGHWKQVINFFGVYKMKTQHQAKAKRASDSNIDRPAELDELNFEEDDEQSFLDLAPEYEFELVDEDAPDATVDNRSTDDDLTPENLIPEDGSRSPHEPGGSVPQDESLSIVTENEIGEGYGLDEAELARVDPLDGKNENK